jgi:hypothetical protein
MSTERDPPRLLDEVDARGPLASALRAGQSDRPPDETLARVAVGVGTAEGVTLASGAASAAAPGASGAGKVLGLKLASMALATAVAGGGGLYFATREAPPAVQSKEVNVGTPVIERPVYVGLDEEAGEPSGPAPSAPKPLAKKRPPPPDTEVHLLQRAQEALGSDPRAALSVAEEHRRFYPDGDFAQERERIAIEALVELGRVARAKSRAARFREKFPGSAHLDRILSIVDQKNDRSAPLRQHKGDDSPTEE